MSVNTVYFIVGPTASGKSDLALAAAEKLSGVVVNADSLQFYRGMDIGTAKPSLLERKRVPHFLFDIRDPDQPLSAAEYRKEALDIIASHVARGPVMVVGGSGFYLQALEKGVYEAPAMSSDMRRRLDHELGERGLPSLFEELKRKDPELAARLSAQDAYRICRALGVIYETGRTVTAIRKQFLAEQRPFPYPLKKIGLNIERSVLRERVIRRTERMLGEGLVAEVETLVKKGYSEQRVLKSVGYKQCLEVLNGELDPAQLKDLIVLRTMQLAKKQMTWFRADTQIVWFDGRVANLGCFG